MTRKSSKPPLKAILIHGMGRTPLSMLIMAVRLRAAGLQPVLFAYVPAFERWDRCLKRLQKFIEKQTAGNDFILVGHSLGTVLARAVLPQLPCKPLACFFLAPPTCVCRTARKLAPLLLYRILFGEIGQLLNDQAFMKLLPLPDRPSKIYAGNGGPLGRFSPFGWEPNDGILAVKETQLPGVPLYAVPALHTFIMNSKWIAQDIVETTKVIR